MYHFKQVYLGLLEYMEEINKASANQIIEQVDLSLLEK